MLQIWVTMKAMPVYTGLPTLSEYMIERGWTKCFARIEDVGWLTYVGLVIAYLAVVEFGIYWMHRELHDIKPLYKHLHATHHIYNKQNTLSPFAGAVHSHGHYLFIFIFIFNSKMKYIGLMFIIFL